MALIGGIGLTVVDVPVRPQLAARPADHERPSPGDQPTPSERQRRAAARISARSSSPCATSTPSAEGFAVLLTSPSFPERQRPLSSRQGYLRRRSPDSADRLGTSPARPVSSCSSTATASRTSASAMPHRAAYDVGYVEAFPLDRPSAPCAILATALVVGAILATLVATFFGWSTSRRLLRPLSPRRRRGRRDRVRRRSTHGSTPRTTPTSTGSPDRSTRWPTPCRHRIEREAAVRFRRQPRAAIADHRARPPRSRCSTRRRADLPERTQQALDVVVGQVRRFDDMVIDLLELSRLDAGATDLHPETVDLVELCDRVSQRYGYGDLPIEVHRRAKRRADGRPGPVRTDPRQPARQRHPPRRRSDADHDRTVARREVGPASPSRTPARASPASERARIFERFARGSAARHRIGTGLGLALVAEHAPALGGEAWVEDRPGGGARFVVRLPTEAP